MIQGFRNASSSKQMKPVFKLLKDRRLSRPLQVGKSKAVVFEWMLFKIKQDSLFSKSRSYKSKLSKFYNSS